VSGSGRLTVVRAKRRFLLFTLVPVTGMVIAAACGFPNPPIDDGKDGATNPDGGDGNSDGPIGNPDGGDQTVSDGSTAVDVVVRDDATAKVDAAGCAASCDCDKDGYHKVGAGCDASVDAGNIDCDDTDPLRNPGMLVFVDEKPEGHDGDWNCNKEVEKGYPEKVTCQSIAGIGCTGGPDFNQPVKCGELGNLYACQQEVLNCVPTKFSGTKKQACR